jgi:hypothetical protein
LEEARILESLGGFRGFRRRADLAAAVARQALYGCALAAAMVLGLKIANFAPLAWGAAPAIVLPLAAALGVLLRQIPLHRIAADVDRAAGLHERVSTALEWISAGRGQTLISRAQLRDAIAALDGVSPRSVFPLAIPRRTLACLPLIATVAALLLLPPWHLFGAAAEAVAAPDLTAQADALEATARELQRPQDAVPAIPDLGRSVEALRELARQMRTGRLDEREAMAKIADAREAVSRDLEKLRREQAEAAKGAGQGKKDGASRPGSGRSPGQQGKNKLDAATPGKGDPAEAQRAQRRAALDRRAQALEKAARQLEEARSRVAGQSEVALGSGEGRGPSRNDGSSSGGEGRGGEKPSSNDGSKVGKGHGKGAADYGRGTTDEARTGQAIQGRKYVFDRQSAERKRWTVAWKSLHPPQRTSRKTADGKVKGERTGRGETVQLDEEVRGAPESGGGSLIDERDVYAGSRRQAEEAVSRDDVPEAYRDLVRNYFEEINPGDSKEK